MRDHEMFCTDKSGKKVRITDEHDAARRDACSRATQERSRTAKAPMKPKDASSQEAFQA